ncbi:MAG: sugar dehydratase [Candidatus Taylorbacteria bacterium RIFCSPHIGHO2_02_FULL_46_13]|uniref:Sugar dehydratase n=1 Tax=Candidatus Taylorbacteria bacterium RIFCSPHIGHO2_02_FULL_46_13 TaxID=1802312 RepID=A0A1G2MU61_9BACT|nr:MAG: sugar dehydratase [Candidatus Taylorbacteria bacterium RIFCSPHIGHO2_02_FULL_46_13]
MTSKKNNFWHDKRVLVTGATGMVGFWLVKDLIAAGARVVAFVRGSDSPSVFSYSGDFRGVFLVKGNVEDFASLERAISSYKVETVFHLAAQSIVGVAHQNPLPTFETNIRGTYNLLEACRLHGDIVKRVVIASSEKAYGLHETLPFSERTPLTGRHPYEVSKSCADLMAQAYHHTYGLPVALLRSGNIFGGADLNWGRLVPHTIRSFLKNQRPIIRSEGRFVRDFLRDYMYVKDISHCYMKMAEALSDKKIHGQAFNVSLEHPLTVLELVGMIQKLMKCSHLTPKVQTIAPGDIHSRYVSASKAHTVLGWKPKFTLEKGLEETIAWYRDYLSTHPDSLV